MNVIWPMSFTSHHLVFKSVNTGIGEKIALFDDPLIYIHVCNYMTGLENTLKYCKSTAECTFSLCPTTALVGIPIQNEITCTNQCV